MRGHTWPRWAVPDDLAVEILNSITPEKAVHPDIRVEDMLIVKKTMPDSLTQSKRNRLEAPSKNLYVA